MPNQPPMPPELSKEQLAMLERNYTLTFKQREWILIHNIILSGQYRLGDAEHILPIVQKISTVAAVDTNIPEKDWPEHKKVKVS